MLDVYLTWFDREGGTNDAILTCRGCIVSPKYDCGGGCCEK